jgi:ABC-type nitrate/sulfonate/bicarbonate transport system ATPase subunit
MGAALVLEGVTVRVGPDSALGPVTLTVPPGEVVGVLSGSRADSRALARAVAGVSGEPVGGLVSPDPDEIGYIPAGAGLLPHLSVQDNITYLLAGSDMARGVVDDEVVTLLTELRLVSVQNRLPHEISPDLRTRTALARAALRYPAALVVDAAAGDGPPPRSLLAFARALLPTADTVPVLVCTDARALPDWLDRRVALT